MKKDKQLALCETQRIQLEDKNNELEATIKTLKMKLQLKLQGTLTSHKSISKTEFTTTPTTEQHKLSCWSSSDVFQTGDHATADGDNQNEV